MPRLMDTSVAQGLQAKLVVPGVFVELAINNQTLHIWSGPGSYGWNGQTWSGVGDLGEVTVAQESTEVQADGATISLSGIDRAILNDSLADIQLGAPCTIWLALFNRDTVQMLGTPIVLYRGQVDAPVVEFGPETARITIPLESRIAALQRGQQRRYTRADQQLKYPDDTAFNWVESLNDLALRWGN